MLCRRVLSSLKSPLIVLGAAFVLTGPAIPNAVLHHSGIASFLLLTGLSAQNGLLQDTVITMQENLSLGHYFGGYTGAKGIPMDTIAPARNSPCGGPLTYCAPTSVEPLPIPDVPPIVSTIDPFTGKGTMFNTPWSNSVAMRITDGTTIVKKSSFGLFYAGQSDPAVRSPMLGARASQN